MPNLTATARRWFCLLKGGRWLEVQRALCAVWTMTILKQLRLLTTNYNNFSSILVQLVFNMYLYANTTPNCLTIYTRSLPSVTQPPSADLIKTTNSVIFLYFFEVHLLKCKKSGFWGEFPRHPWKRYPWTTSSNWHARCRYSQLHWT